MVVDRLNGEQRREKARLIEEALRYNENGDWSGAVAANQAALEIDPDDVATLNRLGRSLSKLGRLREAYDAYERARQLDPANAVALRHVTRLTAILEAAQTDTVAPADTSELRADHFIMEIGRSAVLSLDNVANVETLATMMPGDLLELRPDGPYLRLFTRSGAAIGTVPVERAHRLLELMAAGNEYSAVVLSAGVDNVRVLIRESYRSPETRGKLAFPAITRQPTEARAAARRADVVASLDDEFTAEPDIDEDVDEDETEVTTTEALADQDEGDDTEE